MADVVRRRNTRLDAQEIMVVQQMLDRKLSHRKIALQMGVSRGTIGRINRGLCSTDRPVVVKDPPPMMGSGPPRRCPNCGGRVIDGTTEGDCFACQVAKYARDIRRKAR